MSLTLPYSSLPDHLAIARGVLCPLAEIANGTWLCSHLTGTMCISG